MRWKTVRKFRTLEQAQAAMQRLRRQRFLDGGLDPLRYWRMPSGAWHLQQLTPRPKPPPFTWP